MQFLKEELKALKDKNLWRKLKIRPQGYLNFCSNDYLGLSQHPTVIKAAQKAISCFGTGSGASRLVSGNLCLHEELEEALAKLKNRQAALTFPSGYMANLGVITTLLDENDTIIIDRLNHASIIDACRLSKAKLQVYPHKDMKNLEKILLRSESFKKRLIVTDSVFSMDGDLAPLREIVKLAKKYNALTMIDEAHATGVLGKNGTGAEEHFKLKGKIDIVMGTLSKALGSQGGFVTGSKDLIDYLKNKSRPFIYTTALNPAAAAAALAAITVVKKETLLRKKLWENVSYLKGKLKDFNLLESETQIIPILIGDAKETMTISEKLFQGGILISGIRPPTVPQGTSRLRLTVTSNHSFAEIDKVVHLLKK